LTRRILAKTITRSLFSAVDKSTNTAPIVHIAQQSNIDDVFAGRKIANWAVDHKCGYQSEGLREIVDCGANGRVWRPCWLNTPTLITNRILQKKFLTFHKPQHHDPHRVYLTE